MCVVQQQQHGIDENDGRRKIESCAVMWRRPILFLKGNHGVCTMGIRKEGSDPRVCESCTTGVCSMLEGFLVSLSLSMALPVRGPPGACIKTKKVIAFALFIVLNDYAAAAAEGGLAHVCVYCARHAGNSTLGFLKGVPRWEKVRAYL